jgi:hypothetical protein
MPGEAYMPDDEDDDENAPNFSTATGNIDFAASIEKVKSVRNVFKVFDCFRFK